MDANGIEATETIPASRKLGSKDRELAALVQAAIDQGVDEIARDGQGSQRREYVEALHNREAELASLRAAVDAGTACPPAGPCRWRQWRTIELHRLLRIILRVLQVIRIVVVIICLRIISATPRRMPPA